jgi:hypothetical protein
MDGNSRWQGWAALALAGLALFIALGGRQQPTYVVQAPVAPAAPAAPVAPGAFDQRGPAFGDQRAQPGPGFFNEERGRAFGEMRDPGFHGQRGPWGHGRMHGFGPFGFLFGIVKLIGFLLLGFLLLKLLSRRFGWRRPGGGPPWAYGHHGPHGHHCHPHHHGEGEQDPPAPPAPERRDEPPATTGETTKL